MAGDYIGTDSNGYYEIGNNLDGVLIDGGASSNTIGVNNASGGQANFICGNGHNGVRISGSGTSSNVVAGNYIGVATKRYRPRQFAGRHQNQEAAVRQNVIGSDPNLAAVNYLMANTIAWNGYSPAAGQTGAGIAVVSAQSANNSILGNSIFENNELGIDLGDDGPTPNSPTNPANGPNCCQNFPTITGVLSNGNGTSTVSGTLHSESLCTFPIEGCFQTRTPILTGTRTAGPTSLTSTRQPTSVATQRSVELSDQTHGEHHGDRNERCALAATSEVRLFVKKSRSPES